MKNNYLNNIWFLVGFVLFFPLIMEFSFSEFVRESEFNTRVGWFIMLTGTALLHRNRTILISVLTLFTISGVMDILYAITFHGVFTTASFEAFAQTNSNEAIEFLSSYMSLANVGITFFYFIFSIYLFKNFQITKINSKALKRYSYFGVFILFVIVYVLISKYPRTFDTVPGFMGVISDYYHGSKNMQQMIDERKSFVDKLDNNSTFVLKNSDKSQTYIIIIGEAMARKHINAYGYKRDTTPNIDKFIKNGEIIAFSNVVSSFAQTLPSLRLALTQKSIQNNIPVAKAISIIDAAHLAGFKTFWISNQQPQRATLNSIASICDKVKFISNDFNGVEVRRYDGLLLPYVKNAVNDSAKHKVIFIHLMGSHLAYKNRYPADFTYFKGTKNINGYKKGLSSWQIESINSYDNSVRYTDYILKEILNNLKKSNSNLKGLIMFSDHGEEVYDTKNFKGHGPDGWTKRMVEIPFLMYTNDNYRKLRKDRYKIALKNIDKPYSLGEFFYTGVDFIGIRTIDGSLLNKNIELNSIINGNFITKKRVVYKKDYDLLP